MTDEELIETMVGVREYVEGHSTRGPNVEMRRSNSRLVVQAYNEGGYNCTQVDLFDLLDWLSTSNAALTALREAGYEITKKIQA